MLFGVCLVRTDNDNTTIRATLDQRPEFCLVIHRLRRSCGGFKAPGLEAHYPGLCRKVTGQTSMELCDQWGRQREEGPGVETDQHQG